MMGTQMQTSELEGILGQLLLPDNAAIQHAQAQLKQFFKRPDSISALVTVLTTSQNEGVRQMAATMLRQRVTKSWMRVPADIKAQVKQTLIASVTADPARSVRQAVARVISIIAKHEVPSNEWPDFMAWLSSCASSEELQTREIGMLVLSYVCEAMGQQLKPWFGDMFPMFATSLQDTRSPTVPLYTIQTLSQLLPHFDTAEFDTMRALLPGLVAVCKALLQHDEQEGVKGMEFFDELMESNMKLTNEDITLIVAFFLEVASTKDLDDSTRAAALSHVVNIAYTDKKKTLLRSGVVPQVVGAVFNIMAEPYDPEDVDADEEEVPVPVHAGFIIQSFAMHLSAQVVVPPALEVVGTAVNSPDKYRRKAAMVVLYMLVEGCSETLRPLLPEILPVMSKALADPEMLVREHACLALAEFSQWLQPQMSSYSAEVLPLLFESLGAPVEDVQIKCLYALNCFCDQLGDDIIPYLDPMMRQLSHMLQTGNQQIREHTVLAIAAAAVAAGKAFEPYLRDVYAYLKQLMTLQGDENVSIRAYATDTLGAIIKNMGPEYFVNDVPEIMASAMASLELDDPEINTCTFGLFGSLSSAFKDDFGPYLPKLIDVMVKYITNDEGVIAHRNAEDALANVDSDDEDEDIEAVTVDPSVMDAKQAAIDVLGFFSTNCITAFAPYLDSLTDVLLPLLKFDYSSDVRKAAITTLCEFVVSANQAFPPAGEWLPGFPARVPLSPQTTALAVKIMPEAIALMKVDYDRMVVLATTEGVDPVLLKVGPGVFTQDTLEAWCAVLADVMTGQATCQAADADDDEDAEKTVAEYDAQLIENACDLVGITAKLLGPSFTGNYFTTFAKLLQRFFKKNSTVSERSCCMGTFADIIGGMKAGVQPYVGDLLDFLMKGMADPEAEVRSNACFAMGLLCEHGGAAVQPHYMTILQRMYPLFTNQPVPEVTDNACGAVCRMIMAGASQLPLDKVLPVLVSALPLKKDFIENEVVFQTLLSLIRDGNQAAIQFLPQLFPVFADAYLDNAEMPKLKPETLQQTTELLKQLQATYPTEFQVWYGALAPELQQALVAGISA